MMAKTNLLAFISLLLLLICDLVAGQSCNTDQNPYCRGNSKLEALCCPYPSICYWSNRDGQAACCPAGQDCRLNGGPGPSQYSQPNQQTAVIATLYTSYPTTYTLYSTTSYQQPTQQFSSVSTAVVVITQTENWAQSATDVYGTATSAVGGAYTTVTSFFGGAFTTVTSAVGGAFSTVTQAVAGGGSSRSNDMPSAILLLVTTTITGGIICGALLL